MWNLGILFPGNVAFGGKSFWPYSREVLHLFQPCQCHAARRNLNRFRWSFVDPIQFIRKNKLPGSKKVNLVKFMLRANVTYLLLVRFILVSSSAAVIFLFFLGAMANDVQTWVGANGYEPDLLLLPVPLPLLLLLTSNEEEAPLECCCGGLTPRFCWERENGKDKMSKVKSCISLSHK